MIDLAALRHTTDLVALIKKKDPSFAIERLLELDEKLRHMRTHVESLRHKKNQLAEQGKAGVTDALRAESQEIARQLKETEHELIAVEKEHRELYLHCPNVPYNDIPAGGKEANKVVKVVGEKKEFTFTPRNHVELGEKLGWFDFAAAALMTGSNFALYKNDAVKLMYALTMFMLKNNSKHGFSPVLPPYMVNGPSLEVAGNFPKFKDQVYDVVADQLYLSPTSEVNLTNMYRKHIFAAQDLPVRLTAWTSCFRREAGGYGATERGLIRIHEFEKVELVTFCQPEHSPAEQDRMLAAAEDILQQLGLHYRISLLAAQDCSFQSAKTYDIEVWMPGQQAYYEVSSISNCTDFQARRGMMRFKRAAGDKTELVHTLNGSSLALPRLMVALMETYQQADGTILLPDIVQRDMLW